MAAYPFDNDEVAFHGVLELLVSNSTTKIDKELFDRFIEHHTPLADYEWSQILWAAAKVLAKRKF